MRVALGSERTECGTRQAKSLKGQVHAGVPRRPNMQSTRIDIEYAVEATAVAAPTGRKARRSETRETKSRTPGKALPDAAMRREEAARFQRL
jgi:hypothetical protein